MDTIGPEKDAGADGARAQVRDVAFRAAFETELDYVWSSLKRLGVSDRDVEDVAHDVFLQLYRKWDQYDASRALRPWLFGFAFRAASDHRRLARHRIEVFEERDAVSEAPLAEDAMHAAEEQSLVTRALESIDLDRRAVLIAYELDETPMKDIAESMQIPLNTAYSRLRTARSEFEAAIKRLRTRDRGSKGEP